MKRKSEVIDISKPVSDHRLRLLSLDLSEFVIYVLWRNELTPNHSEGLSAEQIRADASELRNRWTQWDVPFQLNYVKMQIFSLIQSHNVRPVCIRQETGVVFQFRITEAALFELNRVVLDRVPTTVNTDRNIRAMFFCDLSASLNLQSNE